MKLVYVSPVPWSSINQRPHFFAKMAMEYGVDELLWIDPYPSRFPNLGDLVPGRHAPEPSDLESMPNLKIISVGSLIPLEPLKLLFKFFNGNKISATIDIVLDFVGSDRAGLVIGKPCRISIDLLNARKWNFSCYDAMDDFPSFYNGLSRKHMTIMEDGIVKIVDAILCSSHALYDKFSHQKKLLVLNACSDTLIKEQYSGKNNEHIFGYIGTIASWFDWGWVAELAELNPESCIRLFGPVKTRVPANLPKNIVFKGAIPHSQVMSEVSMFDVAIIPFLINDITHFVDPVKYYEYALSDKPIISTAFGEMLWHHKSLSNKISCPYSVPDATLFFPHNHLENKVPRWSNRFEVVYEEVVNN